MTTDDMKEQSYIYILLFLGIINTTDGLSQTDESLYRLDNIMHEIVNTRIDVLEDTMYFNQQMPYYKMFYDMLNDSVKIELLKASTELWYKEGFLYGTDSIRGEKLDFFIKISLYFQHFYQEEQTIKYREKWKKEIGDSLHFVLYVDNKMIPSTQYQLFCVFIRKDNQEKSVFTKRKGTSSIRIKTDGFPIDCIFIVKYKRKYIPVAEFQTQHFNGARCCCNIYTRKNTNQIFNAEIANGKLLGLDAYVHTTVEPFGTAIETRIPIQNLNESSKKYKKLIDR